MRSDGRLVARQHRSQVEAEAVDVHLADPVAQAVENQAPDDGLIGIQVCRSR